MAKYKISIDKIVTKETKTTEYQKVADTGNERDGKAVYDYVPTVRQVKEEENIFECLIENLDVDAVIKSIYKL